MKTRPESQKLVSVLIPVYNGEDYVCESIESVLQQEEVAVEILIGNNASTDGSIGKIQKYTDRRIEVFDHPKNLGIYGNLNFLVERAKGDYIKIVCADDRLLPKSLEKQVRFMDLHPEVAISRCLSEGDLNSSPSFNHRLERMLPPIITASLTPLAFGTFGNLPGSLTSVLVRKSALQQVGKFNESLPYAGDFDMWYRVAKFGGIGILNEECVWIRRHAQQNSVTLNQRNELEPQTRYVFDSIAHDLPDDAKTLVRWHATVHIVSQQISKAGMCFLHGDRSAFAFLFIPRKYSYSGVLAGAVCVLTGFRRWGANWSSKALFNKIVNGLK